KAQDRFARTKILVELARRNTLGTLAFSNGHPQHVGCQKLVDHAPMRKVARMSDHLFNAKVSCQLACRLRQESDEVGPYVCAQIRMPINQLSQRTKKRLGGLGIIKNAAVKQGERR